MKFLLGLLVGAAATLLAASVIDYEWQPPTRLAANVPATTKPMAIEPDLANPGIKSTQSEIINEVKTESTEPIRSVTIVPLPAVSDPGSKPAPATLPTLQPSLALPRELASQQVTKPQEPLNRGIEMEQASEVVDAAAGLAMATAVIWKPFHSEVSAAGFARRLSVQLGYPFRALREGPARYHVVFDYDTEQQRELLRSQVVALTGFEAI